MKYVSKQICFAGRKSSLSPFPRDVHCDQGVEERGGQSDGAQQGGRQKRIDHQGAAVVVTTVAVATNIVIRLIDPPVGGVIILLPTRGRVDVVQAAVNMPAQTGHKVQSHFERMPSR